MTRGLVPPDTLSDDEVHTLRTVRRDMYTNGAIGGGEYCRWGRVSSHDDVLATCAVVLTDRIWIFGFFPHEF